ncbi:GntR family transcriptional regulator [Nonomuraea wenchangensis]|uniref:GntR family transcriptional regulator n=1 Tax=Nonomuraea wenchangensis TaxID=568860 RepID=UPI003326CB95
MDNRVLAQIGALTDPIDRLRLLNKLMSEYQGSMTELASYRRHAIAEARDGGMTTEEIGAKLGVSHARISQMSKGPMAKAPAAIATAVPKVLVARSLPTDPAVRGSKSLFLMEAEQQGLRPDRKMLYVGPEPASEHIATCLQVEAGDEVIARRKMMTANDVPVRIATSYFRADLFADTRIAQPEFVLPTLQAALEALGYRFGRAEEVLTSRRPTAFEAETLQLEPDEWVVQVVRASYSTEDTPIHTLETICAATRHIFPIGQAAGADEF